MSSAGICAACARCATHKRGLLRAALGSLADVSLHGVDGGLHVLVRSPAAPAEVAGRLRARGVHVDVLAEHCWAPVGDDGLLLDYGRVAPTAFERALALIARRARAGLAGVAAPPRRSAAPRSAAPVGRAPLRRAGRPRPASPRRSAAPRFAAPVGRAPLRRAARPRPAPPRPAQLKLALTASACSRSRPARSGRLGVQDARASARRR